jgi:hypothetical protein
VRLIGFEKKFDPTPDFCHQINWQEYLNKIYSVVDIAIPVTERVIVVETDYLKQFIHLLDQTPPRVLGTRPRYLKKKIKVRANLISIYSQLCPLADC